MEINSFGFGINDSDIQPFLGSDFAMTPGWTAGKGSKPRHITLPATFVVPGDLGILATVTAVDISWREHRWEHRASDDGLFHDAGPGWVIDLDPNTWVDHSTAPLPIPNHRVSRSYLYGNFNAETLKFTQILVSPKRAA
jgi:hypothetical protein